MAIKTWTGAGANELWNTALNWSGGTIPIAADDIVFDGVAVNGKKNCTFNVSTSFASINFTGYTNTGIAPFNGTFTFSTSLNITGALTLGVGSTYLTSGTVTSFTLNVSGTSSLTSNGKILPINLVTSSGTFTINDNSDFAGNFNGNTLANNIRAATGAGVDLRVGGNINLQACTTNATNFVIIKGYGTAKTFSCNGAGLNHRVNFVSGSTYTSGAMGITGASFYTVESGGQFTGATLASQISVGSTGTLTLSGFNASNNSNFAVLLLSLNIILLNDTVLNGLVIQGGNTVTTTTGAKLLLEGNLTGNTSTTTIDFLEFSGTTLSTISIVTSTNFQIKNLSFNKTGAGSVNFTSTNFTLAIPVNATYNWTHTSGLITASPTSNITISNTNALSTLNYSESIGLATLFTFNTLSFNQGRLQLNARLRTNILNVNSITFTGTHGFTTNNFTCTTIGSIITLQNIIANPSAEYIVNGILTLVGTAASRIVLQAAGSSTFSGTISPVGQLNVTSGIPPSVGMILSQATLVSPVGLIDLLPNRPEITSIISAGTTFGITPAATTTIGPTPISMRAGYKAKFTLSNNGLSSQSVFYVQTQDIDSSFGITILSAGSNGDNINNSTIALFRTLNWGPLVATSGSVYYTFVN